MLKGNKTKIIISSVITILPLLFGLIIWNDLPDTMTTHWGFNGEADGFSSKGFAVFFLPIFLLFTHLFCLVVTSLDKKQANQNKKALEFVFWIIPIVSLLTNGMMYAVALGKDVSFEIITPVMLGVCFILVGNYMPKTKQNHTLGIKISWTLKNEENWNKTHRISGKVWTIGGIIILLSALLPIKAMMLVMICTTLAIVIIPFIYSYRLYKAHQEEGLSYDNQPKSKAEKMGLKITAISTPLIIILVVVSLFTGNIEVDCKENSFEITASYWTDIEVPYSEIDSIEYREGLDVGIRTHGFGSPKLSMGTFKNDEFGKYTLYAYTKAEEFIVLTSDGKTLVIGMRDGDETQALYDELLSNKFHQTIIFTE